MRQATEACLQSRPRALHASTHACIHACACPPEPVTSLSWRWCASSRSTRASRKLMLQTCTHACMHGPWTRGSGRQAAAPSRPMRPQTPHDEGVHGMLFAMLSRACGQEAAHASLMAQGGPGPACYPLHAYCTHACVHAERIASHLALHGGALVHQQHARRLARHEEALLPALEVAQPQPHVAGGRRGRAPAAHVPSGTQTHACAHTCMAHTWHTHGTHMYGTREQDALLGSAA